MCATKYASQIFDVGFASKRPLLCGVVAPRRLEAGNPHTLMQKISFNARIDTLYHGKEAVSGVGGSRPQTFCGVGVCLRPSFLTGDSIGDFASAYEGPRRSPRAGAGSAGCPRRRSEHSRARGAVVLRYEGLPHPIESCASISAQEEADLIRARSPTNIPDGEPKCTRARTECYDMRIDIDLFQPARSSSVP